MMVKNPARAASHGLTLVLTTVLGCSGTYTVGGSQTDAAGGEVKVRAGETRDVSLTPARPAYEVTGFDAARINRIGVSLRVPTDTDGVATVIIRGMRVGSAD
jgi:hypothetical protein